MFNLFSLQKHELKSFLMFADVNVESPEPIQPDITGASSAAPSPQMEAITKKVLRSSRRSFHQKLIQSS